MTDFNLSPLSDLNAEIKPFFSNEYMLGFFNKFCNTIKSRMWGHIKRKNARYDAKDFLEVFFYSELTGRSIGNASERLNRYFLRKKRGKQKSYTDGRKKREVPHQTGVNKFLRSIGLRKAKSILRECLDCQLKEALELKLISKKVNVLIDFTEHDYYGKRDDKMIKGTKRGRGTNKMRHYLGFSLLSKNLHLYVGLEQIAKGQKKVPIIIKFLHNLRNLGFKIQFVLMDREFYNAELIKEIKAIKSEILIPSKSYRNIKKIIEEYLRGIGNRVRTHYFSTAPRKKKQLSQKVYLILRATKRTSLLRVKRDFQKGILTLMDATKQIYTIMTTQKPKKQISSWSSRTSQLYKKRWNIETGFSDLNRINRRWKSSKDNVRYLDTLVRFLLYNSWKMNKKLIQKSQKKYKKMTPWTLNQNQDKLKEIFLMLEKKSHGVIG